MIYLVPGEFETIKVYDFQGTLKYTKINTETKKVLNGIGKRQVTNLAAHNLN